MLQRPGWALLGALVPTQFLLVLSPLGPFGAWALVGAALWLCRRDPDLRAGVPWAFAALAGSIALGLVGVGFTVGSGSGPLASFGDDSTSALALGFFLPALAPAAVVLAVSRDPPVRGLARGALASLGLGILVALAMALARPSTFDGTYRSQMSVVILLVALACLLVLLAFALPLARAGLARMRGGAAAEA